MRLKGKPIVSVEVRGNQEVPTASILSHVRTRAGDRFDPATVAEDYQRIYGLRKFSNVEARVEPTSGGGVIIVFVVSEQRQIKAVKFVGNSKADEKSLLGVIDIKVGEAIDPFRVARARSAIEANYRE